jgi:hypothetical protein
MPCHIAIPIPYHIAIFHIAIPYFNTINTKLLYNEIIHGYTIQYCNILKTPHLAYGTWEASTTQGRIGGDPNRHRMGGMGHRRRRPGGVGHDMT